MARGHSMQVFLRSRRAGIVSLSRLEQYKTGSARGVGETGHGFVAAQNQHHIKN